MVCIDDKFCDIKERNVTIRSENQTTNIYSLGFWDIRECVTLWRLILWSLGCTRYSIMLGWNFNQAITNSVIIHVLVLSAKVHKIERL